MCGIAGELRRGGVVDGAALGRMNACQAHRGPDAGGVWRGDAGDLAVGFAHRRLRIIDLSDAGAQPMANEDESVVLVYNGEVYNYRSLRRDLESGFRFRSTSDTEVLLRSYEAHGLDFLDRVNGMFALALWDRKRRRLVLARDRVGIKPLVYAGTADGLVFASEVSALLQHPAVSRETDPEMLATYVALGYVPGPATVFAGIRKVAPGEMLVVEGGDVSRHRYWTPYGGRPAATREQAVRQLRVVVADAVQQQLVSDVPLGAFLSGGVDSSIVVGLMSRAQSAPVETFHLAFAGDSVPGIGGEAEHARAVARHFGTQHHEVTLGQDELLEHLPRVMESVPEPLGSNSMLPTHLVSQVARQHVTVALSGDGPDEVLGGYAWHRAARVLPLLGRVPHAAAFRGLTAALAPLDAPFWSRRGRMLGQLRRALRGVGGPADAYARWLQGASPETLVALLGPRGEAGLEAVRPRAREAFAAFPGDAVNAALAVDTSLNLVDHVLAKVDLMSMQHGLEVRVPLLDHRVLEVAFAAPGAWKVGRGGTKLLLRDAFPDVLPRTLLTPRKRGFEIPIALWLQRELRETFHDVVTPEVLRETEVLDPEAVHRTYDEHVQGRRNHAVVLWNILALCWWWRAVPKERLWR